MRRVGLGIAVEHAVAHRTTSADRHRRERGENRHPEEQRPLPTDVGESQGERRPRIHRTNQMAEVATNAPSKPDSKSDKKAAADFVSSAHQV